MKYAIAISIAFLVSSGLAFGAACVSSVAPQPAARSYIDDPLLGKGWALVRDCAHPETPGRLVAVPRNLPGAVYPENVTAAVSEAPIVQIRAGEQITLLKDSETLHLRLQAVAMERASRGQRIRVRLAVGKTMLAGVVVGPGQVALETLPEISGQKGWRIP
jgi:Chaperone for flagella basal body P-ring formation